MKLYADTANLKEIEDVFNLGAIRGVTTNPSLIAKEPKGDFNKLILNLANFCYSRDLSLSVEVFETEYKKMLKEAKELSEILKKYQDIIKIKIPVTKDGLAVIKQLKELDIKTNATACYTEQQLCLASAAGASYIAFLL